VSISARNPRTGENDYLFDPPTQNEIASLCGDLRVHQSSWKESGVDARISAMQAWKKQLEERQEELVNVLKMDTGRIHESILEVESLSNTIDRWCDIARNLFDRRESVDTSVPFIQMSQQWVPYSLVGIISPWNFPILLTHIDAIPALLAGCSVIIKPSEITPRFVEPLKEIAQSVAGLEGVLCYVQGDGETGVAIVDEVDLICFTGSVATGRKVGEQAARNFIPAFLELGGKDAAIVLKGADLDRASSALVWASMVNAGQSCQSIERVYVEEAIHDPLVDMLVEKAGRLKLAYPECNSGEIGPIISPKQTATIIEHIEDATEKGGTVHCGGKLEYHGGGDWIQPTVISKVNHDMKIVTAETFGPILAVLAVSSREVAVELANDTDYGLSGAVFAGTEEEAMAVAEQLDIGGISINDAALTAVLNDGEKDSFKYSGLGGTRMGPGAIKRFLRRKALYSAEKSDIDPWWFDGEG
tara:strand:+ start:16236 stop:17654 length:1419 start_codon:yes stop_codon:yes gene_type:complete